MYTATIQKCGDDYFIPLSQGITDGLGLKEGDLMEVRVEGDGLIILKAVPMGWQQYVE